MGLTKTEEQLATIETAKSNRCLKINAYAGAAKTTTLSMIAEEIPSDSLMLVFNKSAAQEAKSKFPSWVEVRTTHSLAYRSVGFEYQHKLSRPKGRYQNVAGTGSEIARYFELCPIQGGHKVLGKAYLGMLVRMCVTKFEQSADTEISPCHANTKSIAEGFGINREALDKIIIDAANRLWEERKNISSDVLITADTYLKLFQLSSPRLNYEIIYLDEAQDTSDCMLDILRKQEGHAKLIVVGDSRQQIYAWRGAVNAMSKLDWPDATLSTTFRYGQSLSDLANKILGNGANIKSFKGLFTKVGEKVIDQGKPYTELFRTNSKLISQAITYIKKGYSINLEVDTYDFCKLLESAKYLRNNLKEKVKHDDILAFDSWGDLKDEAEADGHLMRVVKMVEEGSVGYVLHVLKQHKNIDKPDIILTTAHKSKGREWDQVALGDDFPSCYDDKGKWKGLNEAEQNLLYVACTRAKKALEINKTLKEIQSHYG